MTRNLMVMLAAGGSAALLGGAYVFQLLGYPPCAMCLWQRWPHAAAILIGLVALKFRGRFLPFAGGIAAGITGGIGLYHTGVERGFWQGPTSCTGGGGGLEGFSGTDLLSVDGAAIVMCDQVSWELVGLSMATWNALFSLSFMAIWFIAATSAPMRKA